MALAFSSSAARVLTGTSLSTSSSFVVKPASCRRHVELGRPQLGGRVVRQGVSLSGFEDDVHGMFTFEDGIFEDTLPFTPTIEDDKGAEHGEITEVTGLIPKEWRFVQEELAKTKRERKREVLDILEKRARDRQEQERMLLEKQIAGRELYRQKFYPRVLPGDKALGSAEDSDREDGSLLSASEVNVPAESGAPFKRASPRNPRSALGNTSFEDLARMLSAGEVPERQRPAEVSAKHDDVESMEVSGSKLLTAKEKSLLKSAGVNFSRITSRKWNPLHTFAASGQINQVDLLLRRGIDVNAQDLDCLTALHRAALCGGARDNIVRYLLRRDADASAIDKDGATVLHHAARAANTIAIKAMLRHEAGINTCDNEGWTPLHVAVQSGRTDIINLLIVRGADRTIENKDGKTPFDLALSFGKEFRYYEAIKILKSGSQGMAKEISSPKINEHRQSADLGSSDGTVESLDSHKLMTEEERACFKSNTLNFQTITSEKWNPLHTFAASGQIKHVDMILRHGMDVNAPDMDGLTALHWAALCARDSIIRYLLKFGADATVTDKDGASALHYATHSANAFAIKALLRRNADVNACDNEGWTPLHIAVQSGRTDIIKCLLSRGADMKVQNKDGNTPLDVALSFGKGFLYYHVVKLLKKGMQRSSYDVNTVAESACGATCLEH